MNRRTIHDTVLLSGWLFADLFLGLMMIFMVSIPGAQPRPVIVPTLTVSPTSLDPTSQNCTGGTRVPQCTVTLGETPASIGSMTWTASSDISDAILFAPSGGPLSPGKSTTVTISALPCQNGSVTFTGSNNAQSVIVAWHCTPPPKSCNAIEQTSRHYSIVTNAGALLSSDPKISEPEKSRIRQKIQSVLQNLQSRRAGFVLSFGGAPISNPNEGNNTANMVNQLLKQALPEIFSGAAFRGFHDLGEIVGTVDLDIFLFTNQICT